MDTGAGDRAATENVCVNITDTNRACICGKHPRRVCIPHTHHNDILFAQKEYRAYRYAEACRVHAYTTTWVSSVHIGLEVAYLRLRIASSPPLFCLIAVY